MVGRDRAPLPPTLVATSNSLCNYRDLAQQGTGGRGEGEMACIQNSLFATPLGIGEPANHEHDTETERQPGNQRTVVYAGLEVSPGDSETQRGHSP